MAISGCIEGSKVPVDSQEYCLIDVDEFLLDDILVLEQRRENVCKCILQLSRSVFFR